MQGERLPQRRVDLGAPVPCSALFQTAAGRSEAVRRRCEKSAMGVSNSRKGLLGVGPGACGCPDGSLPIRLEPSPLQGL